MEVRRLDGVRRREPQVSMHVIEHPAIERVAADPADADRLSSLTAGAAALYNCTAPAKLTTRTTLSTLAS
jgi:hypothetical protein